MNFESEPDLTTRLLKIAGSAFLVSGCAVLLALLFLFGQFISDPTTVTTIGLFTDFLESGAPPITVVANGREAEISIDGPLRAVLVVFVGGISIVAVGSVLHACIGGGLQLLKFADKRVRKDGT